MKFLRLHIEHNLPRWAWFPQRHPRRWWWLLLLIPGLSWWNCLPEPLFEDPVSTVLLDHEARLLGATIAADGQWRFPALDSVPDAFAKALITFEDQRFAYHPGVDPLAMVRAIWQNLREGGVVSGGSTLTMQVIRLARKGKARTLWEKCMEVAWAIRLEWQLSKEEILALYASHAPFGGNVVGLEAAAWKYFGRSPEGLTWAEASMLAVLPNAPGLMHPGRNREPLQGKRDRLLNKLHAKAIIDEQTLELALAEPLPEAPGPLPMLAPHLLQRAKAEQPTADGRIRSSLDRDLQRRSTEVLARHHRRLRGNGIHNACLLVANVETGAALAYVGNVPDREAEGQAVDVITAARSSGSVLKPLLFAAMLEQGELLPQMLVGDVPSYYGSFSPHNFDREYDGAVAADEALARSLNVPAVRMLYRHGVDRFRHELIRYGFTTLFRPAEDYGLSLILGGAEVSPWDLAGAYASLARTLRWYRHYNGRYDPAAFRPLTYLQAAARPRLEPPAFDQLLTTAPLSAGSIWPTFQAMVEVSRPGEEAAWRNFGSSRRVAWKTGTSYGFRDAWAVGVTPDHVVVVWVGNADGEGRPGLIGSQTAGPILFDLISQLPATERWFPQPFDDLVERSVCIHSGHLAGSNCPQREDRWIPIPGARTTPCPYHQLVPLSADGRYRVHSDCVSPSRMLLDTFFVLPPQQERYYRTRHPQYRSLPSWRSDCLASLDDAPGAMTLVYPGADARIYLPRNLQGEWQAAVFQAEHRSREAKIFWHLDGQYLGTTEGTHEWEVQARPGMHKLVLVDDAGFTIERMVEFIARDAE